jgi:NADP-dependent 3-hydroxy acid dehydrogenase YdfG
MDLRLDGKVALVTGAFGGLGRDFALMLARAGAAVALSGRRIGDGRKLADAMRRDGARVEAIAMDVTDRASVDAAVESARDRARAARRAGQQRRRRDHAAVPRL